MSILNRISTVCLLVGLVLAEVKGGPPSTRAVLPAFGVELPSPPEGWNAVNSLNCGWFSAEIAGWSRSAAKGKEEQIILQWGIMQMHSAPAEDDFRASAAESFGDQGRQVNVPHSMIWPTLRFEPIQGATLQFPRGLVRNEAIAVNNVVYLLSHFAPTGDTEEGRKAFNVIAEALKFSPPATLGQSFAMGHRRVQLPGIAGVTLILPEPFRLPDPEALVFLRYGHDLFYASTFA